ncbi:steroid delta-isomerase [Mycobacterium sp. ST-F2]|uniref:nuclear transport factor 2 family protein n=1 Tax=Mycobacterium sp. ST-F2 TaxID=1490484 RepID=UPI00093A1910|nr:nuclear transport factor 2 family protein [Mycobacterium sp. ST-F2]OKH79260.1 steroid delta-isomerase [Mycobacterium sp. ST-F2]
MASVEQIQNVVARYVELLSARQPETIVDLFADNATIEDPVGTEPKTGRQTLIDFYTVLASMDEIDVELLWSKVAADTAVFSFELRSGAGGHRFELRPVDIMIFDDDAKIVSLRAVFDPATDITPIS